MKTIWALFSIANEYDQPSNNLECFWFDKPGVNELKHMFSYLTDEQAIALLDGKEVRVGGGFTGSDWRIREVESNKTIHFKA